MKINIKSGCGDCKGGKGRPAQNRRLLSLPDGEKEDYKCMCREFREQIEDPGFEGYCHCMLYYKAKEEV